MIALILFLTAIFVFYKWYTSVYSYWDQLGIPSVKGTFPWGSDPCLARPKKFLGLEVQEHYKKLSGKPYGGIYVCRRPELVIRDPNLIKHILVRDFSHFRDRSGEVTSPKSPLTQNLFALEGWKWRAVRVKLTPTFTSGKLKLMYGLFVTCAQRLEEKLAQEQARNDVIDIKEIIARFTTEIIGSCAFGLDVDSLNNDEEPLRLIGKRLFSRTSLKFKLIELLYGILPSLRQKIRISRGSMALNNMFMNIMAENMEQRQKRKIRRNDFVDLLLDLKEQGALDVEPLKMVNENGQLKETEELQKIDMDLGMITAQCFVFFIAGYETSSSVQSYALYELAFHQSVQDRVRREIEEVSEKYGGINYQALHDMPYLDQVINETIRKYPTLHSLTRVCTKTFEIPETNQTIPVGTKVVIPVYSLHHDSSYFPDPERFDPERFSDDNKSSITPFTFLPFGEGPRNCIGMRFGLLQTKIGLVTVLKKHKVLPTKQTVSPLVMSNSLSVISQMKGPIILRLENI